MFNTLPTGGGNPSGMNASGGSGGSNQPFSYPGATPNPYMPSFPSGTNMPPMSYPTMGGGSGSPPIFTGGIGNPNSMTSGASPAPFPANNPGGVNTSALGNPANLFGFGAGTNNTNWNKGLGNAGIPGGIAQPLWEFLANGAGFNPQVLQNLIAAMQPQVARGEANINEQFAAEGLGFSSPAAIGLGDYLSQVNLNELQIGSQMYEQATQNYMNVLMGLAGDASGHPHQSGIGSILGGLGSLAEGAGSIIGALPI